MLSFCFCFLGSYVPGQDFDPKSRQFSPEELRPQPMSKKSKKQVVRWLTLGELELLRQRCDFCAQYVPDDMKDDKYWARRRKNNMAAKRSRDARRVKENQIAMRAAFLEKEVVSGLFLTESHCYAPMAMRFCSRVNGLYLSSTRKYISRVR